MNQEEFEDIYFNKMGMCGCGDPDGVMKIFRDVLQLQDDFTDDKISYAEKEAAMKQLMQTVDAYNFASIVLHICEHADLTEHGSGVGGSWLTDKGKQFLEFLKKDPKI